MNERIRELANSLGFNTDFKPSDDETDRGYQVVSNDFAERFAELIAQECVAMCDQAAEENSRTAYTLTELQEFAPVLVAKGCQAQAEKLSRNIKSHFGLNSSID
jgi:hypothetical protein